MSVATSRSYALGVSDQYHFDPDTYLAMVRAEVPEYDALQAAVVEATDVDDASSILDLGSGVGTTARLVLDRHPGARLVGIDESPGMAERAREALPEADVRVARLQDPLPTGPFDVVTSALAVHHLDAAEKAGLFERVAAVLASGGRFVLGDVVVPDDPNDAVTPLEDGYDQPSRVHEQLLWLRGAGLRPRVTWASRDLAVIAADR
jgi:tRNA (cmo5U34)-methyltransferase